MANYPGEAWPPNPWYAFRMGKTASRTAYDEWLALGEGVRAELVDGRVVTLPRPTQGHSNVTRGLCRFIGGPFHDDDGLGGPGGWWIFPEVDVRFASGDVVVPDVAGWRREHTPHPHVRPIEVVPDWVCEIASPSTAAHDRVWKAELYARHGVGALWLVDPEARTLEAFTLDAERRWLRVGAWDETATARIAPFEAVELAVGRLFLPREAETVALVEAEAR